MVQKQVMASLPHSSPKPKTTWADTRRRTNQVSGPTYRITRKDDPPLKRPKNDFKVPKNFGTPA